MDYRIFELVNDDLEKENFSSALEKIEDFLKTNPDDLNALKMKAEVLLRNEQHDLSISFCNELIKKYPNDTEILNIKAMAYFYDSKYNECSEIINEILKIDPKNVEARGLEKMTKLLNETDKTTKSFDFISKNKFSIIFFILLFLIYFHPTKETMVCDSSYSCTVKREFIDTFKDKKEIKLSKNSTLTSKTYYIPSKHGGSYNIYAFFDSKNPFIMYFDTSKSESRIEEHFVRKQLEFYNYLKNPSSGFEISSYAESFVCYIWLGIFLLFFVVVCFGSIKNKQDE